MNEIKEKKHSRLGVVAAFVCAWLLAACGGQPPVAQNMVQNAAQNVAAKETVTDKAVPETEDVKTGEPPVSSAEVNEEQAGEPAIDREGAYTSAEDVALYLHTYEELPGNFMTKKEAKSLGWSGGGLDDVAYGMCIGGDYFGNYEGLLPEDKDYHECDIDTLHQKSRGAKRLIYSEDGYIYYTADHYESFTQMYPE